MKFCYLLLFCLIISCNNKNLKLENKTKKEVGFLFMGVQEETNQLIDLFVPTESVGTNKSVLENFLAQKKKEGFLVNIDRNYRLQLMSISSKFYNELFETNHILPINDFQRRTIGTLYILPIQAKFAYLEKDDYSSDTTFIFDRKRIDFFVQPYTRVRVFEILPIHISDRK